VQQGLPDVCEVGVDQRDPGFAALTEGSAQAGGEFKTAGTAADDYDSM
jgi:hypothetical protein